MYNIKRLILVPGHGGNDPGAVNGPHNERDQVIKITERVADKLRQANIDYIIAPHHNPSLQDIHWTRSVVDKSDWVLNIHRDSANFTGRQVDTADISKRCGVFFKTHDNYSQEVASKLLTVLRNRGASGTSWIRPDSAVRFGALGIVKRVQALSHLVELGFMQGDNSDDHLDWLADILAESIIELIGKKQIEAAQAITLIMTETKALPWEHIENWQSVDNHVQWEKWATENTQESFQTAMFWLGNQEALIIQEKIRLKHNDLEKYISERLPNRTANYAWHTWDRSWRRCLEDVKSNDDTIKALRAETTPETLKNT